MDQVLCSIALFKDVKWDRKGQKEGISTSPRSLETQQEIKKLIKEAHTLVSRRKQMSNQLRRALLRPYCFCVVIPRSLPEYHQCSPKGLPMSPWRKPDISYQLLSISRKTKEQVFHCHPQETPEAQGTYLSCSLFNP